MSEFRRFFIDKVAETIVVEGDEFQHAVNVLRIRENENIIICDNSGNEYLAVIVKIEKKAFTANIIEKRENLAESKTAVKLIFGYLKSDKNELVVQKAVELGVKEIVVFSSEFSSAYINEAKLLRLNKVAVEAAKQCGRSIAPKVVYAENFSKALSQGNGYQNKLFACEFADSSTADIAKIQGSVAIVVGSEGGFSASEGAVAAENGYQTISLGKRILRAETASIALVAILMFSLGELQ